MKLNNKRTILVGLAFLSICAFWQMHDNVIPLILTKTFHMNETYSGVIMAAGTLLCLTIANTLIGAFTDNVETIIAGGTALRIISAGFIVSTVSVTASGALEGIGMGVQSLVISLLRYIVVILPSAFILCRLFGGGAVWNAFWITEFAAAVVAEIVYRGTIKRTMPKPR